jgi:4-hydroxy-2-oxoheptanedioate aldolase
MAFQHCNVRARLRERGFLAGSFVEIAAPEIVEILGAAGMDFAVIDCEHAALRGPALANLIRASASTSIAPIVRVRENRPAEILEALDLGAAGLHIPQVATREQAEAAVRAARFPPAGERGFNPFVRAAGYGSVEVDQFRRQSDEETLLVLHIEGGLAVSCAEAIVSVPGVDVAFLGPYDLSMALGIPGQVTDARVLRAARAVRGAAERYGVALGAFANSVEHARVWLNEGVRYLAYGVDSRMFLGVAAEVRRQIDAMRPQK